MQAKNAKKDGPELGISGGIGVGGNKIRSV
jgi:hypothetical protein